MFHSYITLSQTFAGFCSCGPCQALDTLRDSTPSNQGVSNSSMSHAAFQLCLEEVNKFDPRSLPKKRIEVMGGFAFFSKHVATKTRVFTIFHLMDLTKKKQKT